MLSGRHLETLSTQTSENSWTSTLNQQTLELSKNGTIEEDEKTDSSKSGKKAQATLEDGAAKKRPLTQLEMIPRRLRLDAHSYSAEQQFYGEPREHWKKAVQKGVKADAAGNRMKYGWDQGQVYRTSVKAEGRTKQDIVSGTPSL